MAAQYLDLFVDQGTDFSYLVNVTNPDGTFVNLTSYSYTAQVKMSLYTNTVNANLFCTIVNVANGQVNIALDWANTQNLAAGQYFYDVMQVAANNAHSKFLTGIFTVNPTSTGINPVNLGIPAL